MKVFGLVLAVLVTACGFGGSVSAMRLMNGLSPQALQSVSQAQAACESNDASDATRRECKVR